MITSWEQLAERPCGFARYGDGELGFITMTLSVNRQRHRNLPDQRRALIKSLREPGPHHYAIQRRSRTNPIFWKWIQENAPQVEWAADGELFHDLTRRGQLFPFCEWLRSKHTVLVGPQQLRPLMGDIYQTAIWVPWYNSWRDYQRIKDEVTVTVLAHPGTVFIISAGPMAQVLIRDLWEGHQDCWMLCTGSIWDVHCGIPSASYQKAMSRHTIERNLRGPA